MTLQTMVIWIYFGQLSWICT